MDKKVHTSNIFDYGEVHHNPLSGRTSHQLELFPFTNKHQKAQITSVPGISPKERNRYRVKLGSAIWGDRLTLDEALRIAKGGHQQIAKLEALEEGGER
jgi:hypothetical protein